MRVPPSVIEDEQWEDQEMRQERQEVEEEGDPLEATSNAEDH